MESNNNMRIVGGSPASIDNFPWAVSMQRLGSHRCGAVIIAPNRLLSAAHCAWIITATSLSIRAGSTQSQSGGQLIQVSRVINHPNYNFLTLNNDINVLWMASSFNMAPTGVAAIGLPAQGASVATGAMATVAGWGATREGGPASPGLQSVAVPIVSNAQCNANYNGGITEGMLCAGFPQGGRDACQGDSGGPLNIHGTLVGIVSWGQGCARPGFPGVYARVAHFRNWINSEI